GARGVVPVVDAEEAAERVGHGMQRCRGRVGRAAPFDPHVRLASDLVAELGQQTGLPEARLADEEGDLPLARGGTVERGAEQAELAIAADEPGDAGFHGAGLLSEYGGRAQHAGVTHA